jgi:hypothetical protein
LDSTVDPSGSVAIWCCFRVAANASTSSLQMQQQDNWPQGTSEAGENATCCHQRECNTSTIPALYLPSIQIRKPCLNPHTLHTFATGKLKEDQYCSMRLATAGLLLHC